MGKMKKKKKESTTVKVINAPRVDMSARSKMVIIPAASTKMDRESLIRNYTEQIGRINGAGKEGDYSFVVYDVTGKIYEDLPRSFFKFANKRFTRR